MEQMFSNPDDNPNNKKFSITLYNNFLKATKPTILQSGFWRQARLAKFNLRNLFEDIALRLLDQLMTRSIGFSQTKPFPGKSLKRIENTLPKPFSFHQQPNFEVTNFSTTATNFAQHYQSVSDQYFVEPKRKATYVFFSINNYMEAAKKQISFEELIMNDGNYITLQQMWLII